MTSPTDDAGVPAEFPTDSGAVLNRDGSVRRKPGPRPGTPRKTRQAKAPGYRAPTAPKKTSSADYRPAIAGLLQLPQLALGLAAKYAKKEETKTALVLDGMTVGLHSANIAEALNTTAQTEKKLADILDKLSTVGPYSLVVMAILTPTVQILANHGIVPPNEPMGVLPKDRLIEAAGALIA